MHLIDAPDMREMLRRYKAKEISPGEFAAFVSACLPENGGSLICDTPGCPRQAFTIIDGKRYCGICDLKRRGHLR
jgi:hypothetical protein